MRLSTGCQRSMRTKLPVTRKISHPILMSFSGYGWQVRLWCRRQPVFEGKQSPNFHYFIWMVREISLGFPWVTSVKFPGIQYHKGIAPPGYAHGWTIILSFVPFHQLLSTITSCITWGRCITLS